jgi:hypothetical protein
VQVKGIQTGRTHCRAERIAGQNALHTTLNHFAVHLESPRNLEKAMKNKAVAKHSEKSRIIKSASSVSKASLSCKQEHATQSTSNDRTRGTDKKWPKKGILTSK